jgi:hypothetical protein
MSTLAFVTAMTWLKTRWNQAGGDAWSSPGDAPDWRISFIPVKLSLRRWHVSRATIGAANSGNKAKRGCHQAAIKLALTLMLALGSTQA